MGKERNKSWKYEEVIIAIELNRNEETSGE